VALSVSSSSSSIRFIVNNQYDHVQRKKKPQIPLFLLLFYFYTFFLLLLFMNIVKIELFPISFFLSLSLCQTHTHIYSHSIRGHQLLIIRLLFFLFLLPYYYFSVEKKGDEGRKRVWFAKNHFIVIDDALNNYVSVNHRTESLSSRSEYTHLCVLLYDPLEKKVMKWMIRSI
jgi:hypothetical protein